MADISFEQVAATLASGILTATTAHLTNKNPDEQARRAIEVYCECLKQLGEIPTEMPFVTGVSERDLD